MNINNILKNRIIQTSVPCRVDLGGTLDISTFYLTLNSLEPSSFNIALDLRTRVTLSTFKKGYIKISSRGFKSAVFQEHNVPLDHPMGLMFACANYFNVHGVHIHIESSSPPKSALGGSSVAAVAIISAFFKLFDKPLIPEQIAWLAHYIESGVAGVPCGMQDQLAAAFGGVNQWIWKMGRTSPEFEQVPVFEQDLDIKAFNSNILVAYCGISHVSKNINSQWVQSFVNGETRMVFQQIAGLTTKFSKAVKDKKFSKAASLMNQETKLRLEITPDVLDSTGKKLFADAMAVNCGARFTGAGGGGCLWAVGEKSDMEKLKVLWKKTVEPVENAEILNSRIDNRGIQVDKNG